MVVSKIRTVEHFTESKLVWGVLVVSRDAAQVNLRPATLQNRNIIFLEI